MKKIIENFSHHFDDYECMWNGIEDIYMNKTGEELPSQFFFAMSGFCSFAYIKTNKSDLKRMVSFGDGRTKQMYKFLAPIVNFDYHFIESKTPELALKKAKKEIDNNYPVVIGALDMYYLDYFEKIYHKEHIPFHYFLMVGYDDEEEKIYFYDCGREKLMNLSYDNLYLAMNASLKGLSNPNTICTIRMDNPVSKKEIFIKSMKIKSEQFLNPQTNFLGVSGIRKLAQEIVKWEDTLGKKETKKILENFVEFCGTVPTIPNRLKGINKKDDIVFACSRDKMSKVLIEFGNEYKNDNIKKAGELFKESGNNFEKLCNVFIDYLLNDTNDINISSDILLNIANIEYQAYELINKGIVEI